MHCLLIYFNPVLFTCFLLLLLLTNLILTLGNISPEDAKMQTSNMEDPYSNDPRRHGVLKPASKKPYNAEPNPPSLLVESFYTPKYDFIKIKFFIITVLLTYTLFLNFSDIFYVRNHLPVPVIDPKTYELEVEIEGSKKTLTLNLDQIKKLPKHDVDATIMCAGNRRSEMTKVRLCFVCFVKIIYPLFHNIKLSFFYFKTKKNYIYNLTCVESNISIPHKDNMFSILKS